jgi:hypothetical protein
MMGRAPFAGVAWQVLHYLEGFRRLGYDVYYVEDTGDWPFDPERNSVTADCTYPAKYIARLMEWCGLADRWAYRAAAQGGRAVGPAAPRLASLLRRADILVNLTGATVLRGEHLCVPVRIYLETDPVLPQLEVAEGRQSTIDLLAAHTHHFTYGENLGAADCGVPVGRFAYQPTRQPVVLDWWAAAADDPPRAGTLFTTVASWQQSGKDFRWRGETYTWSKHHEFLKFLELPRRAGPRFELALAPGGPEAAATFPDALALLTAHGWCVRDALTLSRDVIPYRDYLRRSRGEFTVAKDQNVRLRSGWFSDRSACYLAAARPVITQETGFSKLLPTGEGLFAFTTMDDVLAAVDAIESDYEGNCRAAREIAHDHFAAERVLAHLLARAGL